VGFTSKDKVMAKLNYNTDPDAGAFAASVRRKQSAPVPAAEKRHR